jgi:hypothetical protein
MCLLRHHERAFFILYLYVFDFSILSSLFVFFTVQTVLYLSIQFWIPNREEGVWRYSSPSISPNFSFTTGEKKEKRIEEKRKPRRRTGEFSSFLLILLIDRRQHTPIYGD